MSNFADLFNELRSQESVTAVNAPKGSIGKFGINQGSALKLSYGDDKENKTKQLILHVKTVEGKDYMAFLQEPLRLSRKGMDNDPQKIFTSDDIKSIIQRGKAGKATEDDILYFSTYKDDFIKVKAYLQNIIESFYASKEERLTQVMDKWKNIVKMFDFDQMLLAYIKLFPKGVNEYGKGNEKRAKSYICGHMMTAPAKVDCFTQWQWVLKSGNKMTYLELPKNIKQGKVFSPVQEGVFTVVEGNSYVAIAEIETGEIDGEGNPVMKVVEHPLTRSDWFMSSKFGAQQKDSVVTEEMSTETSTNDWGTVAGTDGWE